VVEMQDDKTPQTRHQTCNETRDLKQEMQQDKQKMQQDKTPQTPHHTSNETRHLKEVKDKRPQTCERQETSNMKDKRPETCERQETSNKRCNKTRDLKHVGPCLDEGGDIGKDEVLGLPIVFQHPHQRFATLHHLCMCMCVWVCVGVCVGVGGGVCVGVCVDMSTRTSVLLPLTTCVCVSGFVHVYMYGCI